MNEKQASGASKRLASRRNAMTFMKCIFAATLMTISTTATAQTLNQLSTRPANQLSLGALSLLNVLNARAEVQYGLIQAVFTFAETTPGAIWISAWPGPRAGGQTPAERCTFVLRTLREALGADSTGKITTSLRMNIDAIVLAAAGIAATEDLVKAMAEQMMLRGIVPLGTQAPGTCQSKLLSSDVAYAPKDDAVWNTKLQ